MCFALLAKCEKVAVPSTRSMSTKLSADDTSLAASFAALRSFTGVATLLEVKPEVLSYYLHKTTNYKKFELNKRTGGKRTVYTPVTPLKIIQKKLNQVLQAVYRGRPPVHGFARGKSIVSNALR